MSRRRTRTSRIVRIAVCLAVTAAACGGGSTTEGEERPLTQSEAARLANVLFSNFDAGGAAFTYTGQLGDDSLVLQGEINFVTHQGRATVSASGPESAIAEVVWSDAEVIERLPALPDALTSVGQPPVEWVVRSPDLQRRELDGAIALIVGLAGDQRDNPQLIQQTEGSAFLRSQQFRGADVDVLRNGLRTSYWLDSETDRLVRFEGNNSTGTRPRIVDLDDFGTREIAAPPFEQVVTVASINEVYDSVRLAN